MNTAKLDGELIQLLHNSGRISEETLLPAVLISCEDSAERQSVEDEGVYVVLTNRRKPREVLKFEWGAGSAPTSYSDSMLSIEIGTHSYLCLPPDVNEGVHPFLVLGAVDRDGQPEAVSQKVAECLAGLFDSQVWSDRLPTMTRNNEPGLVSSQAVKEAYRSVARSEEVWEQLITDLTEMTDEASLSGILGPEGGDFPDPKAMDEPTRSRVIDRWFELAYSE